VSIEFPPFSIRSYTPYARHVGGGLGFSSKYILLQLALGEELGAEVGDGESGMGRRENEWVDERMKARDTASEEMMLERLATDA